jgi:4-hydroxy-3-methylbut-2-enyl diphosphate reductase
MNLAFTALRRGSGPVYSVGPLIHNQAAFDLLEKKGMSPYEEGMDLPEGAVVIIRAHGLPPEKELALRKTGARVVDATCPKVKALQRLVEREADNGRQVLIWGQGKHPEVEGLLGYAKGHGVAFSEPGELGRLPNYGKVLLVAQTTQDQDGWEVMKERARERYAKGDFIAIPTICEATISRQREAKALSKEADAVVVVGGKDSGNTKRLLSIASMGGKKAIAVEDPGELPPGFLDGCGRVGLIAGASSPNWQIRMVAQALSASGRDLERGPGAYLSRFFRALVLSNIYVGLGCGVFGWAMAKAMGFTLPGILFCLFAYFSLANHLLHGFADRASSRFNDPDRAAFLFKYGKPLVLLGVMCALLAQTAAWAAGWKCLACLLLFSALSLGLALSFPKFGGSGLAGWRKSVARLGELSFNKTTKVSLGWALLLTVIPWLHEPPLAARDKASLISFTAAGIAIFLQLFSRNFLMDMLDAMGDRVFERETPASFLGHRKARRFLVGLLALWALCLALFFSLGALNQMALLLIVSGPVYNGLVLRRLSGRGVLGGFGFDLLVDGQFFLSGLLALLWGLFVGWA